MHTLTVIHPFGDYKRGDPITEPDAVEEVLKGPKNEDGERPEGQVGENAHHCVKVKLPE